MPTTCGQEQSEEPLVAVERVGYLSHQQNGRELSFMAAGKSCMATTCGQEQSEEPLVAVERVGYLSHQQNGWELSAMAAGTCWRPLAIRANSRSHLRQYQQSSCGELGHISNLSLVELKHI
jgi:hypothetical protein